MTDTQHSAELDGVTICLLFKVDKIRDDQVKTGAGLYNGELMTAIQEFRCEVCGTITSNPIHWFVIQCENLELTVIKWNSEAAKAAGARHYCGEAHAQIYISRWFDSVCSPAKPDFTRSS